MKTLTFKKWCDSKRKHLKRWYRNRANNEQELSFEDWAQQFYRIYVADQHPA